MDFEQGPIRPPSEAGSLLVRITRSCAWNRCAFCPVYKGSAYQVRRVEEILADLDAMARVPGLRGVRRAFLQDADPLAAGPRRVLAALHGIRERFPSVRRVTTYARSDTLRRQPLERMVSYREAGLCRVHVGLESGCDAALERVAKGVDAATHLEGGRRVLDAGLHLCTYVMPGLGGRAGAETHIRETARLLVALQPSAVRLRSTVVSPGTPLHALVAAGRFQPQDEAAMAEEIRDLLLATEGLHTRLYSDHDLNLLPEIRGELPRDRDRLVQVCERFLGLSTLDRNRFVLGRRLGLLWRLGDLAASRGVVDHAAGQLGVDLDASLSDLIWRLRRALV